MGHETSSTAIKLTSQLSASVHVYYDDKLYSTGLLENVIKMYVHGLSFYYYFFLGGEFYLWDLDWLIFRGLIRILQHGEAC